MHKYNHKTGFTLIEVLLGLMIFAIISLTLYNIFWLGLKIDSKSNDVNKSYQEARLAFELISKDLENTFSYDFSASYPEQVSFEGKTNEISLLIPTDRGICKVRYYLGVPDGGRVSRVIIGKRFHALKKQIGLTESLPIAFLMRDEILLSEYLAKTKNTLQGEIIAVGIKKASLKIWYGFLKHDETGKGIIPKILEWKNEWKDRRIPHAIRLQMSLLDAQDLKSEVVLERDIYLPEIGLNQ